MDIRVEIDEDRSARVPDSVRNAIFGNVAALTRLEKAYNAAIRKERRWFELFLGSLVALFALLYASKAAEPVKVLYNIIDNYTGRIYTAVPATNARDYYSAQTVVGCLQEYVELRQRYIWQTDKIDFHKVAIRTSPEEQVIFKQQREDLHLAEKYQTTGYFMVSKFFSQGATLLAKGEDQTEEWDLQFIQAEATPKAPATETRLTARLWVQFHADLPMSEDDARDNRCRTYVIRYKVT